MSSVVYEILITVLILSLVILGIGLARGELQIVHAVLENNEDIEKINNNDYLKLDRDSVNGGDVIGFIRYFKDDSDVEVRVTVGEDTCCYIDETYDSDVFSIDYESIFTSQVIYEDNKIKRIICEKQ